MNADLLDDLARPGIDRPFRCLLLMGVAIAQARWGDLAAICDRARQEAVARGVVEEALLQGVLFFGFPRVISAFEVLQGQWPRKDAELRGADPEPGDWHQRGRELFARIYGPKDQAVRQMLRGFHPELHDFVIEAAYGRILSRAGLDVVIRELLAVANLGALDQRRQLVSHARGAVAVGASREQVAEAAWSGLRDPRRVEELLARLQI